MKIIVAPDKFKGSISSIDACSAIAAGIMQVDTNAGVIQCPMADGGDGFSAVLKHYLHTNTITCTCVDPLMRKMQAAYEFDTAGNTAIIELAAASGLELLEQQDRNPLHTSSFGTGLMICDAIERGAGSILLGLGGSATNDAGIGILAALGFKFLSMTGVELDPIGENLQQIHQVNAPAFIPSVQFTIACDVDNPLFGSNGAASIYAKQKGAGEQAIMLLDHGLQHFAALVEKVSGKNVADFAGAGAAGGVAAGITGWFSTSIVSGAHIVLDAAGMTSVVKEADLIITGEGMLDAQTSNGKVVHQLAAIGREFGVPVVAICGDKVVTDDEIRTLGLAKVITLVHNHRSRQEAIKNVASLLRSSAFTLVSEFANRG